MKTEELVACLREKMKVLTAELRDVFVGGQAMGRAEREEKYNGLDADTKLVLGLGRDFKVLEFAHERAEAAYVGFKTASGRFTQRQGA